MHVPVLLTSAHHAYARTRTHARTHIHTYKRKHHRLVNSLGGENADSSHGNDNNDVTDDATDDGGGNGGLSRRRQKLLYARYCLSYLRQPPPSRGERNFGERPRDGLAQVPANGQLRDEKVAGGGAPVAFVASIGLRPNIATKNERWSERSTTGIW